MTLRPPWTAHHATIFIALHACIATCNLLVKLEILWQLVLDSIRAKSGIKSLNEQQRYFNLRRHSISDIQIVILIIITLYIGSKGIMLATRQNISCRAELFYFFLQILDKLICRNFIYLYKTHDLFSYFDYLWNK